jgi:phage gpG-like protein
MGKLGMRGGVTPDMLPNITFDFSPSVLITAGKIDRFAGAISSFKEPLTQAITEVMIPSFRANFAESGRPDKWEPLAEGTLDIRRRMGGDQSPLPLVKTGALMMAATSIDPWKIGDAAAIFTDLPENVWYGKIHQGGYEGRSMKALARKMGGSNNALNHIIKQQQIAMATGGTISGGGVPTIPARPFILFQDEDEDDITEIFIDWVDRKLLETWPR